ncbi:MAG: rod shape-determining protein MreD [Leptospiraceae bacterium]|nr:rod shape-determining protein MreD [Leptospiraceae bacterium]MCP5498801.1 rod shape-determining protein MreD [Leptospiraceae bacterium]
MMIEKIMTGAGILLVHFLNRSPYLDLSDKLPFHFQPDLMFIFVIFFSLRRGALTGLWVGFFGGLLTDLDQGAVDSTAVIHSMIGLHTFSYSIIGYLMGKFGRNAYNENFLSISITMFVLTLLVRGVTFTLYIFFFKADEKNYAFFGTAFFNSILSPIFFSALSWIYRMESAEVSNE